jgi:hypothetical protein
VPSFFGNYVTTYSRCYFKIEFCPRGAKNQAFPESMGDSLERPMALLPGFAILMSEDMRVCTVYRESWEAL